MKKKKILFIDDEGQLTKVMKLRLEADGYAVVTANDPVLALAQLKDERPDLIILDIVMPGMSGYRVCDEIKLSSQTKDIPVILCTAQAFEKEVIKEAHSFYGADDYILKPFNHQLLLQKIEALMPQEKR